MVSQHHTAVITVCTNRPTYAATMLQHLDRQDADLHVYVVVNSSSTARALRLVGFCADKMDKPVTLIRLWSMHTQIGLAYNCGLWHAMMDDRHTHFVKLDDDVAIKSNGVSELLRLCTEHDDKAVSVLLPWGRGGYYRWADMKSRRVSRKNTVGDGPDYKYIYGACFMVPRRIHNQVGMFSEEGQRGMDLDFAVRVQRAGNEIVEHGALRALHLGNTTPTEGDKEIRKSRKYCEFGKEQVCSTIWSDPAVRHALIAQVYGAQPPAQVAPLEKHLDKPAFV